MSADASAPASSSPPQPPLLGGASFETDPYLAVLREALERVQLLRYEGWHTHRGPTHGDAMGTIVCASCGCASSGVSAAREDDSGEAAPLTIGAAEVSSCPQCGAAVADGGLPRALGTAVVDLLGPPMPWPRLDPDRFRIVRVYEDDPFAPNDSPSLRGVASPSSSRAPTRIAPLPLSPEYSHLNTEPPHIPSVGAAFGGAVVGVPPLLPSLDGPSALPNAGTGAAAVASSPSRRGSNSSASAANGSFASSLGAGGRARRRQSVSFIQNEERGGGAAPLSVGGESAEEIAASMPLPQSKEYDSLTAALVESSLRYCHSFSHPQQRAPRNTTAVGGGRGGLGNKGGGTNSATRVLKYSNSKEEHIAADLRDDEGDPSNIAGLLRSFDEASARLARFAEYRRLQAAADTERGANGNNSNGGSNSNGYGCKGPSASLMAQTQSSRLRTLFEQSSSPLALVATLRGDDVGHAGRRGQRLFDAFKHRRQAFNTPFLKTSGDQRIGLSRIRLRIPRPLRTADPLFPAAPHDMVRYLIATNPHMQAFLMDLFWLFFLEFFALSSLPARYLRFRRALRDEYEATERAAIIRSELGMPSDGGRAHRFRREQATEAFRCRLHSYSSGTTTRHFLSAERLQSYDTLLATLRRPDDVEYDEALEAALHSGAAPTLVGGGGGDSDDFGGNTTSSSGALAKASVARALAKDIVAKATRKPRREEQMTIRGAFLGDGFVNDTRPLIAPHVAAGGGANKNTLNTTANADASRKDGKGGAGGDAGGDGFVADITISRARRMVPSHLLTHTQLLNATMPSGADLRPPTSSRPVSQPPPASLVTQSTSPRHSGVNSSPQAILTPRRGTGGAGTVAASPLPLLSTPTRVVSSAGPRPSPAPPSAPRIAGRPLTQCVSIVPAALSTAAVRYADGAKEGEGAGDASFLLTAARPLFVATRPATAPSPAACASACTAGACACTSKGMALVTSADGVTASASGQQAASTVRSVPNPPRQSSASASPRGRGISKAAPPPPVGYWALLASATAAVGASDGAVSSPRGRNNSSLSPPKSPRSRPSTAIVTTATPLFAGGRSYQRPTAVDAPFPSPEDFRTDAYTIALTRACADAATRPRSPPRSPTEGGGGHFPSRPSPRASAAAPATRMLVVQNAPPRDAATGQWLPSLLPPSAAACLQVADDSPAPPFAFPSPPLPLSVSPPRLYIGMAPHSAAEGVAGAAVGRRVTPPLGISGAAVPTHNEGNANACAHYGLPPRPPHMPPTVGGGMQHCSDEAAERGMTECIAAQAVRVASSVAQVHAPDSDDEAPPAPPYIIQTNYGSEIDPAECALLVGHLLEDGLCGDNSMMSNGEAIGPLAAFSGLGDRLAALQAAARKRRASTPAGRAEALLLLGATCTAAASTTGPLSDCTDGAMSASARHAPHSASLVRATEGSHVQPRPQQHANANAKVVAPSSVGMRRAAACPAHEAEARRLAAQRDALARLLRGESPPAVSGVSNATCGNGNGNGPMINGFVLPSSEGGHAAVPAAVAAAISAVRAEQDRLFSRMTHHYMRLFALDGLAAGAGANNSANANESGSDCEAEEGRGCGEEPMMVTAATDGGRRNVGGGTAGLHRSVAAAVASRSEAMAAAAEARFEAVEANRAALRRRRPHSSEVTKKEVANATTPRAPAPPAVPPLPSTLLGAEVSPALRELKSQLLAPLPDLAALMVWLELRHWLPYAEDLLGPPQRAELKRCVSGWLHGVEASQTAHWDVTADDVADARRRLERLRAARGSPAVGGGGGGSGGEDAEADLVGDSLLPNDGVFEGRPSVAATVAHPDMEGLTALLPPRPPSPSDAPPPPTAEERAAMVRHGVQDPLCAAACDDTQRALTAMRYEGGGGGDGGEGEVKGPLGLAMVAGGAEAVAENAQRRARLEARYRQAALHHHTQRGRQLSNAAAAERKSNGGSPQMDAKAILRLHRFAPANRAPRRWHERGKRPTSDAGAVATASPILSTAAPAFFDVAQTSPAMRRFLTDGSTAQLPKTRRSDALSWTQ